MRTIEATVTSNGRVTIPVEIRRHLGMVPADKVAFVPTDDGRVEVRPARYTLESVIGSVPPLGDRDRGDFRDQIEDAMEEEAERIVRDMGGL